jgi:hypothetical protein
MARHLGQRRNKLMYPYLSLFIYSINSDQEITATDVFETKFYRLKIRGKVTV